MFKTKQDATNNVPPWVAGHPAILDTFTRATISKDLEAVVARRISYIAETYRLLPENHFGGRPKRSAEQALNLLVEKIYEAWRRGRVLSLVSFDVARSIQQSPPLGARCPSARAQDTHWYGGVD